MIIGDPFRLTLCRHQKHWVKNLLDTTVPIAYRTRTIVQQAIFANSSTELRTFIPLRRSLETTKMFFEINPSNGVPVYEQVARQITFAIASGAIQPGEMIPSVREMARELAINPNTVARAFRDLQDSEIIQTVRGTGLSVTKNAKAKCTAARTKLIRERIRDVLDEARQSQLTDDDLAKIIESELQNSKKRKR